MGNWWNSRCGAKERRIVRQISGGGEKKGEEG
jgi:hypothetical protein